jgi:raffinose/stachyose/melibiose transport system substrate-binding protein
LVSSAAASDAAFKETNAAFEAKYPGVHVVFSTVDNGNYPATKSSRLTAGNVDIVASNQMRTVPDYAAKSAPEDVLLARAGALVDLTNKDFVKNFTPSVVDAQSVDGHVYSIPTGLSYSTGVYYNKTMFAKYGIALPTTWTELQSAVATLESNGQTAFGIGGRDTWPAGLVMLGNVASAYPTVKDKSDLAASFWSGKTPLDSAKPVEILTKTQWVFDHAQKNFAGTGYDEIPALFAAGNVAMVPDGTWNSPTILTAVSGAFDVGYFPFPGSDTAADNAFLNGKVELMLAVPTSAPNKDAAMAWLKFFSEPANYTKFVATSGFSPAEPNISGSAFLDTIAPYTAEFRPAWDTIWIANNDAGQDAVYPFNYPALSPLGTSGPSEAAKAAQSSWASAL